MKRSAYQLVNRGSPQKPRWTVEHNGQYVASDASHTIMAGFLKQCRKRERRETEVKK